jgi:hypothetical protein
MFPNRTIVEMKRRVAFLKDEVEAWKEAAHSNQDHLGVHASQLTTLEAMMDVLLDKQAALLQALRPELTTQQFALAYHRLANEIVGTHDLWRIFRYIFSQLLDERLGSLLDAANRVAADCYIAWLNRARQWHLISENEFREPPLVYLEAVRSPATANRGMEVQALGFPVRRYGELRLPIPLVLLPFDQVGLIWLTCTLHHEVGHNLDQDLQLGDELAAHLEATVPAERRQVWTRWSAEILADALAVASGGVGFGYALASLLFMLAPRHATLDTTDSHPDHYLRIQLVAAMLDQTGVDASEQAAEAIRQAADTLSVPAGADGFLTDCPAVAALFLSQPLAALGNRPLRDLNADPADDAQQVAKLARFLQTGLGFDEPLTPLPPRLVPMAAELALVSLDDADEAAMMALNDRAYAYLHSLERPTFLAGAARADFLRGLAEAIDFTEDRV